MAIYPLRQVNDSHTASAQFLCKTIRSEPLTDCSLASGLALQRRNFLWHYRQKVVGAASGV